MVFLCFPEIGLAEVRYQKEVEGDASEMVYLLLAIICSALVSVCMRLSETHIHNNMVMFTANYAICLAISLLYTDRAQFLDFTSGMARAAILGIVSGFLYLINFVLLQKNILLNGVILSSAAMKLGSVLIPVAAAVTLFHEDLGWMRLAGVVSAAASVLLINGEKTDASGDGKRYWLMILLFASGVTDMMANVYDKTGAGAFKNHYLAFTFLAAMAISLVMALVRKETPALPDILCGILIGVPNYFSARFLLLALGDVAAVVTYPVFSVGTIIVITTVGVLAFREKLTRQKKCALVLILAALALLNV